MKKRKIFIGTSGYNYKHWANGVFYPAKLPANQWLEYYAQHFNTVELNVTFYRLPAMETFAGWYQRTPGKFTFAAKGSRFITHIKKLKEPEEPLRIFFNNASSLKEKLAVVLWQFPPNFKKNIEKLSNFSSLLKKNHIAKKIRHTFEFRHPTWFCEEVYKILEKNNFSLCIAHSKNWPLIEKLTADFIYLRFHGGTILYGSNYSEKELKEWINKVKSWLKQGKDLYGYFNNDACGYAVKNARRFSELLIG